MALRRLTLAPVVIAAVWAIASFAAMTYGVFVNMPDNVHTNFGLPFNFATHTTSVFAGPVDTWDVEINALAADLAFWLVGMVVILLAGLARNLKVGASAHSVVG